MEVLICASIERLWAAEGVLHACTLLAGRGDQRNRPAPFFITSDLRVTASAVSSGDVVVFVGDVASPRTLKGIKGGPPQKKPPGPCGTGGKTSHQGGIEKPL
jgi:hypothetical protein